MNATSCHEERNFSIKCLPSRTARHRNNGAGHWLAAFRKAEEQKYKNLHQRRKPCRKFPTQRAEGRTLDGAFLLRLHCVDKPTDLCSVHISERNVNSVKAEELREFHNVAFIDASANSLSLDSLSCFLSLRELNLSLNGLKHMKFCAADFPHLQVLDLSYNSVSASSVAAVGRLPRLKVLHLTGNDLLHLPPNMGSSCHRATELRSPPEEGPEFPALEVLHLDDNRLTSGVFWSIKNLKRLKHLNLRGNCISEIPYLLPRGSFKSFIEECEYGKFSVVVLFYSQSKLFVLFRLLHPVFEERNPKERVRRLSQVCNWEGDRPLSGACLPLPELQILNLCDNKITQEEALLAVAGFPAIRELDICSNPLTSRRTREPPSLVQCLQHRLGITVKSSQSRRCHSGLLMIQNGSRFLLKDAPRPPRADRSDASIKRKPDSSTNKGREDAEQHPECVFLTQVNDIPQSEDRKSTHATCVTLRDCAVLMDAKPIPNLGIQAAVRMLEARLRNRNVYKDSKPKVDVPKPHRRREKSVLSDAKALPPIKPPKQRDQRAEDMMKEIRESTSRREVPLSEMGVSRQEALLLLRDMKTKYKRLYEKTMEEAAGSDGKGAERLGGFSTLFVLEQHLDVESSV
ncbi:X-ray radiation resistance-associated protein 1 isoform X1 [Takifugu flavidus]|uniref:X-ray radiation resistance-associated protein 1 isoform X1 n=1 Tax=Takifugu flavidus TaxID=433684 RepID=UPI0025447C63|nr:X-ray radiation resistance-associated protein 1 isoform X1 [Takifugu flavidus]